MQPASSISWQAHEYEHKEKTPDWFWALGIIGICVIVASVIKGNYVFALFVLVACAALGFYGAKHPDVLEVELTKKGLTIQKFFYDYSELKAFWVEEGPHGNKLHILSGRVIMPIMTIPLGEQDPDEVREFLLPHLEEKELKESSSHRIMEMLGF